MRANNISVFWIQAYKSILDYCNVLALLSNAETFKEVPQRSILHTLLKRTRAHLESAPSRWILIFDEVAGECDFKDFIEPYLPRKGRVLMTSRVRNCSQWTKVQVTSLEVPSNGYPIDPEIGDIEEFVSRVRKDDLCNLKTHRGQYASLSDEYWRCVKEILKYYERMGASPSRLE